MIFLSVFLTVLFVAALIAPTVLAYRSIVDVLGWGVPVHTRTLGVVIRLILLAATLALLIGGALALLGLA